jgi:hypothetical protein
MYLYFFCIKNVLDKYLSFQLIYLPFKMILQNVHSQKGNQNSINYIIITIKKKK